RHRREYMRADRLAGIANPDRNLDGRIEYLAAPVRRRLVGVATHVQLLRGAADVDRDRLQPRAPLRRPPGGGQFFWPRPSWRRPLQQWRRASTSRRPWRRRVASPLPRP